MKSAILKTATIVLAFFASFLPGFGQSTAAFSGRNESPIEVKFLGLIKNDPLFKLELNNSEAEEFLVTIKNNEGSSLYSEKIKGVNLSRKYKINILDDVSIENFNIRFEVRRLSTNESSKYNVTYQKKVLENFLIARL